MSPRSATKLTKGLGIASPAGAAKRRRPSGRSCGGLGIPRGSDSTKRFLSESQVLHKSRRAICSRRPSPGGAEFLFVGLEAPSGSDPIRVHPERRPSRTQIPQQETRLPGRSAQKHSKVSGEILSVWGYRLGSRMRAVVHFLQPMRRHVRVDLRRREVDMAQKLLDRTQVCPAIQ